MSDDQQSTAPEGDQDSATEAQRAAVDQSQDSGDDSDDDDKFDATIARRRLDKAQREAKNLREQLAALKPLAEEAEKRRQGELTEAQRLAEQKAALEVQLAELTTANVRREAAEAAGLPSKFVKFITAAEPGEALAQAKELAKALQPSDEKRPDLRQGARGNNAAGTSQSHDDLLRQMARQR